MKKMKDELKKKQEIENIKKKKEGIIHTSEEIKKETKKILE
jgi:hypothetical protein